MIVVVTGGEQSDNKGISDAVKRDIADFVKRNQDEPVQRLAEIAAFKQVHPIPHDDHDDDNSYKNCNVFVIDDDD